MGVTVGVMLGVGDCVGVTVGVTVGGSEGVGDCGGVMVGLALGVRVVEGAFAHTDHFAVADNRVDIVLDDGATSSLWWATKNEWLGLVDVSGLEIEALYGDFDRSPVDDDSGEYIFVVRHATGP